MPGVKSTAVRSGEFGRAILVEYGLQPFCGRIDPATSSTRGGIARTLLSIPKLRPKGTDTNVWTGMPLLPGFYRAY